MNGWTDVATNNDHGHRAKMGQQVGALCCPVGWHSAADSGPVVVVVVVVMVRGNIGVELSLVYFSGQLGMLLVEWATLYGGDHCKHRQPGQRQHH